ELATAELHYAVQTLGQVQKLIDAVVRVKAQLPELLERSRRQVEPIAAPTAELHDEVDPWTVPAGEKLVQLPIAHQTRVVFHTCLHDDGEAAWLQLEGGTEDVLPDKVRLMYREEVLETRRCIPMPAGRKSHARPDGHSTSKVW